MMRSVSLLVLVALALAPCLAHTAEQQQSKRALLAAETELSTKTTVEGGRKLLCLAGNCVRPLSKVQSHKTPSAPKLTRKTFDRKMPKRSLLASLTELEAEVVEGSRKLLCLAGNCVRPLSKVQSHKTPTAPKLTRKTFDRKVPKRALLASLAEAETEVMEGGRKLLCFAGNCVRPLATVQNHKAPQAPKMTRKNFDRKMP